MKQFLLLIFTISFLDLSAQLNVELLSTTSYPSEGNDIWGYVAPDGSEYAIFGTFNGVSVVNVTDPRNPVEVDFVEQQGSTWRDIKTWGDYAFVTSDQNGTTDGLLIIDFTGLPDSISYQNVNHNLTGHGIINTCHNIFIDEFGFAYLAGCNINNGGLVIFDVATTPGTASFVGAGSTEYSHDVYVRDNKAYSAELRNGVFRIYDVEDKLNITALADQETPFSFTHNLWLSDDGNTIFTTDELANASVASYDISDLDNIRLLDEFRPAATLNEGVIPHNVHVWDDWLIVSYYVDGCIIVDAARPDNLIEVGNWDTFLNAGGGFSGAWGAYPFLPSGNILVGDINAGLFVLGPTYVRAGYLEGVVSDAADGAKINNASIQIEEIGVIEFSKANGDYKTGSAIAGDFEVTVSAFGYKSETRVINLTNGVVSMEDFELESLPRVNLAGQVVSAGSQDGIAFSTIKLIIQGMEQELFTDANGNFDLPNIIVGDYEVLAGSWGHRYRSLSLILDENIVNNVVTIELEKGYEDIFSLDLGWTVEFDGIQGAFERGTPVETQSQIAPKIDSDDIGTEAYITGNVSSLFDAVLFGATSIESPVFDISEMKEAVISYQTFFWTSSFNGNPSDEFMLITLNNGTEEVVVDTINMVNNVRFEWNKREEVVVSDHLTPSDNMTLKATIIQAGFMTAVEGGFDDFKVYEAPSVDVKEILTEIEFIIYPNPSDQGFELRIPESYLDQDYFVNVYNISGQRLISTKNSSSTSHRFGDELDSGVYFVQLESETQLSQMLKVVKQ